jgi:4-hydroxy-3-polyprenylbenzoate decarboxylase
MRVQRLVLGISGASGIVYGVRPLEARRAVLVETHLVVSDAAKRVAELETEYTADYIEALADVVYRNRDIGGAIALGSFLTLGAVIAPCSIKSPSDHHQQPQRRTPHPGG